MSTSSGKSVEQIARKVLRKEREQSLDEFLAELGELEEKDKQQTYKDPLDVTVQQPFSDGQGEPYLVPHRAHQGPYILPLALHEFSFQPSAKERIEKEYLNLETSFQQLNALCQGGAQLAEETRRVAFQVPLSALETEYKPKLDQMVADPDQIEYEEVAKKKDQLDSSFQRQPTGLKDYTRGKIGNVPFRAGGAAASEDQPIDRNVKSKPKTNLPPSDDPTRFERFLAIRNIHEQ